MSYIQIEFAGKQRGFKFNQGALMTFRKKVDLNDLDATSAYAIFWAGLTANARAKEQELTVDVDGKEGPLTFEMVCDAVDELDVKLIEEVTQAFVSSRAYEQVIKNIEDGTKKKNSEPEMSTQPIAMPLDVDT